MNTPTVSIGMPVFNGANFIRCAIDSILCQDYHDLELVISDNCSTDETPAICEEAVARDPRVRYYRTEKNRGAAWNYNRVFELSTGEYFKWAAHDDECHPAMIRRCVEVFESAPKSVAMVYPLAELIDDVGSRLQAPLDQVGSHHARPHRRLAHLLWSLNMCDPVFGLIRTEYLRKTRLIGPFFGADYVLLAELAMLGEIRQVDEILFRLRAHPKRSVQANPGARAQAAWYDPNAAWKWLVMPSWERMVWELMKSTQRSSLPYVERTACGVSAVATHYWRRTKDAGGRLKRRIRALFRSPVELRSAQS
jgi:glycosyltransferase involved in cell wall biosynthesis